MKIYLDVCCLNRPFDDQRQDRVHLESEAVLRILDYCQKGKWRLIGSEAIDFEIFKIPDDERKQKVTGLALMAKVKVIINTKIEKREAVLEKAGFKPMDALHLACAEDVKADVLLSTDDKFCQNIIRNSKLAKVRVDNPLNWLMEVTKNEHPNFQS